MEDEGVEDKTPSCAETATHTPLEDRLADVSLQQVQEVDCSKQALNSATAGEIGSIKQALNSGTADEMDSCKQALNSTTAGEIGSTKQVLNPASAGEMGRSKQVLNPAAIDEMGTTKQVLNPVTTDEMDSDKQALNPATTDEIDDTKQALNLVITTESTITKPASSPVVAPELGSAEPAVNPDISTESEDKSQARLDSFVEDVPCFECRISEEEDSSGTQDASSSFESETNESCYSSGEESDSSSSGVGNAFFELDGESKKYETSVCEKEGGIMSKNEVNKDSIHIPTVSIKITGNDKLERIGAVHSILEKEVIIRSGKSIEDEMRHTWTKEDIDKSSALNSGTLVCFENRSTLGVVFDTFGPVHSPYYVIRFNSSDEIASVPELKEGAVVFAVQAHRQVVAGRDVHVKGYDTSNKDDEECDTGDYSDDEEERVARRKKNMMHRQRVGVADDDHRPFKQTRGDKQSGVDEENENVHAMSRGRGRGRRRGRVQERNRGPGHSYGDSASGAYRHFAASLPAPPPPGVHFGAQHIAQQIFEARLQQGSMNPPGMGVSTGYVNSYPQGGGVYVDQTQANYGSGSSGFVHPMPQFAPVMWNGPQYVQMPVSPMQHYPPMHGIGYPSVPHAQMQAMAGVRNMSVQENGSSPVQPFYAMPAHSNMLVRPPNAIQHPNNAVSRYNPPQPPQPPQPPPT